MNQTKFREIISTMPPLHHSVPGVVYSADNSEVVQFVMALPGFKEWVWKKVQSTGRVIYDKKLRKWKGITRAVLVKSPHPVCPRCLGVGLKFVPPETYGDGGRWTEDPCEGCDGLGHVKPAPVAPAAPVEGLPLDD